MVNKVLLTNNVMLISEPIAKSQTVAIGFWFSIGSRSECEGCYGITHFTEHLIFKGTSTKTTHDIACTFDRIGGYINAYTERESVCVYCVVPSSSKNVRIALETLCDIATNAIFPDEELERERIVVENEINAAKDDLEESALDFVSSSIWPNQSISRSITGSISDVESITKDQIHMWYERYFVNGELTAVIAGNYDEDEASAILSSLPQHRMPLKYPLQKHYNESPKWNAGNAIGKSQFSQCQLFKLYPYHETVGEKENYTLSVFNAVVGDTMSSRLFEVLREKNGLCYNVYSFLTFYEDASAWCAYVSCDKENLIKAKILLDKEIKRLLSFDIDENELKAAKEHLCGEEIISSDDMEYCIKRNQHNYSMGYSLKDKDDIVKTISGITKNDVIDVIKKLIKEENSAWIYYGPKLKLKDRKEILCRTKLK